MSRTKTDGPLAKRLDDIARKHGWERTTGGEHAFMRLFPKTRVRIIFSMRGHRGLAIELFDRSVADPEWPYPGAMLRASDERPKFGETADTFLERTLAAFDLWKVMATIVSNALSNIAGMERDIAKSRARLAKLSAWFDSETKEDSRGPDGA